MSYKEKISQKINICELNENIKYSLENNILYFNNIKVIKAPEYVSLYIENQSLNMMISGGKLFNNRAKKIYSLINTFRSVIKNFYIGEHKKVLILNGLGFQVEKKENTLIFSLNFSHKIYLEIPENINIKIDSQSKIIISSVLKDKAGIFANRIKHLRKFNVYKGTGIIYENEKYTLKTFKKKN